MRTDCQRSQDPTIPDQVVFEMLRYPVNWALRTFAEMLTKHCRSFSGQLVLKRGLLGVYTFLKKSCAPPTSAVGYCFPLKHRNQ